MTLIGATNIAIAAIELLVVALILRETQNIGRGRPPVVWAIGLFFVVDAMVAVNRSAVFWPRSDNFLKGTMIDVIGLIVIVFLFLNVRQLTRAAVATLDMAQYRAAEYERARRDYTQVVRHRVMNPVTIILGAADTLRAGAIDNTEIATQLLDAISDSARVIQSETLEPERRDDLERGLSALPSVDDADRPGDGEPS